MTTYSATTPAARPVALGAPVSQGIGARGFVRPNADSAVRTWSPPV